MKYVYVAGPYSNGDVGGNVREALLMGDMLVVIGCEVFIPHLSHLWHMIRPHDYEFWMERDMAWLKKCDALLRLPGESLGADREVQAAVELGIPVYLNLGDLIEGMAVGGD